MMAKTDSGSVCSCGCRYCVPLLLATQAEDEQHQHQGPREPNDLDFASKVPQFAWAFDDDRSELGRGMDPAPPQKSRAPMTSRRWIVHAQQAMCLKPAGTRAGPKRRRASTLAGAHWTHAGCFRRTEKLVHPVASWALRAVALPGPTRCWCRPRQSARRTAAGADDEPGDDLDAHGARNRSGQW